MKPAIPSPTVRFGEVSIRGRGRLPHWETNSGYYFVTFRLSDSLPRSLLERIVSERKSIVETARQLGRELSQDEQKRLTKLSNKKIEDYLDRGNGACHLRHPEVARLVADAIRFFEAKRYRLMAWCVMPNHVHIVFRLLPGQGLATMMHSLKSYTANRANKILGRCGSFWQREYYDHLVRNGDELQRAMRYVAENPLKAGLRDWPWVEVKDQGLDG